ncbi:MAG TPA: two-component regulator propeller domain-containing protein, partial [Rhodothermales bacterium]
MSSGFGVRGSRFSRSHCNVEIDREIRAQCAYRQGLAWCTLHLAALLAFIIQYSLFIVPAYAQGRTAPIAVRDVSVRFEHLTVADGLSQTTIYAIYQDRQGFMWFATQDGLNRYDGHSMKVYRHVPFDTTALGDNTVVSITEDREGYLWIGSGGGLHRMNPDTETFYAFRNDPFDPTSLGSDVVRHAREDREGLLWIATSDGLDRYDRATGEFTHFRHDPADPSSISSNGVLWIYEDTRGMLWIATANGLNRMRADRSGFDHFLTSEPGSADPSPSNYHVQRLLERPEEPGILWVGTAQGLVRLTAETGSTATFLPTSDPNLNRIPDLVQDPIATNVLWMPVPGAGLGRYDLRNGEFSIHGTDPGNPHSLSTTNTERVFVDRSGMLWVGVNGVGVDRFNPATVGMSHFRHDPGNPGALPGSHVRGIYQDVEGGLWAGSTDLQGVSRLSRFDPASRMFRHFEHRAGDPRSLGEGRVRSVLVDRTGAVWVGVDGSGLARMAPGELGRFRHMRPDPSNPASLSHAVVRYLLEDHSGTIWVATNGGLDRVEFVDEGSFVHYRHDPNDPETLTSDRTSVLFESRAGFLWVGADGGLNKLDPLTGKVQRFQHDENDRNSLASDAILAINERSREPGVIWVGTFGGGLNRLDVATREITHFTELDGLPNNTVYGILEDEQGRLWMSTNLGLARLDPETKSIRSFGLDVG